MPQEDSNEKREDMASVVFPILDHFYKLFLDKIINKFKLKINKEFWWFLTLFVFSYIMYKYPSQIKSLMIIFGIGVLLNFAINNFNFIERFISKRQQVREFLVDINQRSISEVIDFIITNNLELKELKKILTSNHKDNVSVYENILKNQKVTPELLKFLIENESLQYMNHDLIGKFIIKSNEKLSLPILLKYHKKFRNNKEIIPKLYINNPNYIKKESDKKICYVIFVILRKIYSFISDKIIYRTLLVLYTIFFILYVSNFEQFSWLTNEKIKIALIFFLFVCWYTVLKIVLYLIKQILVYIIEKVSKNKFKIFS